MEEVVIGLAKAAILVTLGVESHYNLDTALKKYPKLQQNGASFVTLTQGTQNNLRGCIGSLVAYQPLYKDIIANAKSAAFRDRRFTPLTLGEFEKTKVEVSILTTPQRVEYKDIADLQEKISINRDGVVLQYDGHRATYLPQVWEQLPEIGLFFDSLCQKAGLEKNCLNKNPQIETYQVVKYKE